MLKYYARVTHSPLGIVEGGFDMRGFFVSGVRHLRIAVLVGLSAAAIVGCGGSSGGGSDGFSGDLDGSQVVPAVVTANSGTFQLLETAGGQYLHVTIEHTIANLTGATINGPAAAGVNAGVLFDVLANQITARGSIINSPIEADWEIDETSRTYLENGELYVLLSSGAFPTGELRGQVNGPTVPETPEGSLLLTDINATFLEGTLLPDTRRGPTYQPKWAARGRLENNYDIAVILALILEDNSETFPIAAPPNTTESINGSTGELQYTSNLPIPANFSETFNTDFDQPIDTDFSWLLNYEVRAADNPSGPVIGSDSFTIGVQWRPEIHYAAVVDTFADIDDDDEVTDNMLLSWTYGLGIYPRPLSFTGSSPVTGTGVTQITGFYSGLMLDVNWGNLTTPAGTPAVKPCGAIDDGEFICPVDQAGMSNTGGWLIAGMLLEDDVPLDDPTYRYTFGFVMDGDGNPDNNFEPDPAFENDFFQGTDLWYTIEYNPTDRWSMFAIDASGAGNPQRFFTDAGAVIRGNMVLVAIPSNEITLQYPTIRFTAFRHQGDFGQSLPYGLDYDPGLDEPLYPTNGWATW